LIGCGERNELTLLDAGDDGLAFGAARERDIVWDEPVGAASVDVGAAIAFEEGLSGNPEDVVDGVDGDDHVRGHAGAQLGRGLIEGDACFELAVPWWTSGAAEKLDAAGKFASGERD